MRAPYAVGFDRYIIVRGGPTTRSQRVQGEDETCAALLFAGFRGAREIDQRSLVVVVFVSSCRLNEIYIFVYQMYLSNSVQKMLKSVNVLLRFALYKGHSKSSTSSFITIVSSRLKCVVIVALSLSYTFIIKLMPILVNDWLMYLQRYERGGRTF